MCSFTFNLTVYSQDFPHMQSRMNWAVRELRWDVRAPPIRINFNLLKRCRFSRVTGSNEIGNTHP